MTLDRLYIGRYLDSPKLIEDPAEITNEVEVRVQKWIHSKVGSLISEGVDYIRNIPIEISFCLPFERSRPVISPRQVRSVVAMIVYSVRIV